MLWVLSLRWNVCVCVCVCVCGWVSKLYRGALAIALATLWLQQLLALPFQCGNMSDISRRVGHVTEAKASGGNRKLPALTKISIQSVDTKHKNKQEMDKKSRCLKEKAGCRSQC